MNSNKSSSTSNQKKKDRNVKRAQKHRTNQSAKIVRPDESSQMGFTSYTAKLPKAGIRIKSHNNDRTTFVGTEYLGTVVAPSTATTGTVLRNDYINPLGTVFEGGALALEARAWEKYKFKWIKFSYRPTVPSTSQGALLMAFDHDYADTTPDANMGDEVIRRYMSWKDVNGNNTWVPFELMVKFGSDPQKFYYTNDTGYDGRLVYQGQLYMVATANLTAATRYGYVTMEYEIDFFERQLDTGVKYTLGYEPNSLTPITDLWSSLLTPANVKKYVGVGKVIYDSITGNTGIQVPAGTYSIEQSTRRSNALTNYPNVPNIIDVLTGQSNSTVTNKYINPANPAVIGGQPTSRIDKFTAPVGGSKVFGRPMTSDQSGTFDNFMFRIIPSIKDTDVVF